MPIFLEQNILIISGTSLNKYNRILMSIFSVGQNWWYCLKSEGTALNLHIPKGKPSGNHLQSGSDPALGIYEEMT